MFMARFFLSVFYLTKNDRSYDSHEYVKPREAELFTISRLMMNIIRYDEKICIA